MIMSGNCLLTCYSKALFDNFAATILLMNSQKVVCVLFCWCALKTDYFWLDFVKFSY